MAAMFSAVNVATGFAGGFAGLRLIGHCNRTLRLIGWTALGIAGLVGLYWNFRIAQFRDALERAGDGASFFSVGSEMGFALPSSPASVALLLLGVGVFLVCLLKGRSGVVDAYWGDRDADHSYEAARLDYDGERESFRRSIDKVYEKAIGKLRDRHAADSRNLAAARRIVTEALQSNRPNWSVP
ncbi:hypothetical protein MMA231_03985 (plasmid) [Asticcacaulis sp. MM231]